jgi:hypothetical protein
MKLFRIVSVVVVIMLVASLTAYAAPFPPGTGNTNVVVQNTGNATAAVVAEYINPSGVVEATKSANVNAKGSNEFRAADSGLGDNWAGSMILSGDQDLTAVGYTVYSGGTATDGLTGSAYSGFPDGSATVYLPSLFQRPTAQYSRITVQNMDTGSADIQIFYYNRSGGAFAGNPVTDSIPEGAQKTYDLGTPGGKVPDLGITNPPGDGWIGSARVVSTNGKKIGAVASTFWPQYSSAYESAASGANTLFFSTISRRKLAGQDWVQFSGTIIQNLSASTTANVTGHITDRNGVEKFTFTTQIPPLAAKGFNTRFQASDWPDYNAFLAGLGIAAPPNDFSDFNGAIWFQSDQPIAGVTDVQWKRAGEEAVNSYRGESAGGTNLYFASVYRIKVGNWVAPSRYTALNIYNADASNAANITVRFYNRGGTEVYSFNTSVPARSGKGYNTRFNADTPDPAGLFAALGDNFQGAVYISADRNVIGITQETSVGGDVDSYNGYAR